MAAARAEEYATVLAEAEAALSGEPAARTAIVRRLRGELRRIGRRDYFPPVQRDQAHAAVTALAAAVRDADQRETEERQDTP
jgi:hypothetical protein